MDKTEKRFEQDIEAFLTSEAGGYTRFSGQDEGGNWESNRQHDVDKCIYMDVLCEFIQKTQPDEWRKYTKCYGTGATEKLYYRLENAITNQGLLHVLRYGIEDMGCKLRLCYFKPETELNSLATERYHANILGCTRQFRYSAAHQNTLDMVLSVNGIPVVALELKNQLTGQNYACAIKQFQQDRSSKEFAFRLNHRFLVYFAVDLYEAWMTTQLKDGNTQFMPFNRGSHGAGVSGGAGNPPHESGYATAYLWEEVLQRDSLLDLIQRFISFVKVKEETVKNDRRRTITKEKMIFPRYHQYDVVRKLVADVRRNGAGTNYLIQHSAGSGKSNSIAWVAYRLASLHDEANNSMFDSVIVVTNRVVLDGQLQATINSFDHQVGLVEAIDDSKNSRSLAEAINDRKRIIICTIQKFLFAHRDMEHFRGRKFAIIVDEAHQGQSGESAKVLRRTLIDMGAAVKDLAESEGVEEGEIDLSNEYVLQLLGQGQHSNQSFFAFTATPKQQTLEIFGTLQPNGQRQAFHVYSMRQAIEEGFILDVLSHYTTVKEAFHLVKTMDDNPQMIEGKTARALLRYYKKHGHTISQKTDLIMSHFLDNCRLKINGKGKAMVVADSRANAVRYYLAIKKYIHEHPESCTGCDVMVAFSGEVTLEENEQPFTEASMNLDEHDKYITTDKKFRQTFHSSRYNILVVANKYQTGFDEPLLQSMYVDKKLRDVAAVQTLSRLNRTAPEKTNTFVLDFENTAEDIKEAFLPYYECTSMEGDTDINKAYDLRHKIAEQMLYNTDDVCTFNRLMNEQSGKKQNHTALGRLADIFRPVIKRFQELAEEDQEMTKDYLRQFNRCYSYVTQLIRLHDKSLFEEYQYTSYLLKLLPFSVSEPVDLENKIKLEYTKLEETFQDAILLHEKPDVFTPPGIATPKPRPKKKDTLQNIIDKVNERFNGNFTEDDRVIIEGIFHMFMQDKEMQKYRSYARDNNTEIFVQEMFPEKFKKIVNQCYINQKAAYKKIFSDNEFYQKVMDAMAHELYKALRSNTKTEETD